MNNALRLVKKTFTVGVVLATITWSIGLAAFLMPLTAHAAVAGDLIKASTAAVYYLGSDGKRYVFPNEKTYSTWYSNFSGVKTITDSELASYPIGGNVTYKPGVKMIKITTDPKVYAVDANGKLRWISSEAVAVALYGATWAKMIDDVSDAFFVNYTMGAAVNSSADFVPATASSVATSINFDKGLGAVVVTTPVGGSGLTVSLASNNPAAVSVVTSDSATRESASLIPMLALTFAASSDGAVNVNSLVFKKGGISADTDVRNVYLYDDAGVRLAEYTSFTQGTVTFTNAGGLFTVPAGSTKTVWVKADLSASVGSGKTISFILNNASGVTTNGAAVSGSFPVTGNLVTTAQVSDNAQVLLPTPGAASPTQPGNVDPGLTGREVWRSTLAVSNQKVELRGIKFLVNGSVTASDLQNFKLSESGTQLGATAQVASDMTVSFDMSSAPLVIDAGMTKTLSLVCDIIGGTNRSFKMSIQKYSDVMLWDAQYGNYVAVDTGTSGGSFSVFENSSAITINTGKLTVSRAIDSPTGPVAAGATNVPLAKFALKSSGEAIKFSDIRIESDLVCSSGCGASATTLGLNDVKLLLDGVQVGQTSDVYEQTAKTFTVNFIIPAGTTSYLTVVGDVKTADGTNITSGTIAVSMTDGTIGGTAKGQVSLQSATVGTAAGQTVTVSSGSVAVTKNVNFSDRSSTISTGVPNTPNVKIGSFVVTAGAGEGSSISQIVLQDTTSYELGNNFQNLKLMNGSTQIGTTIGSLNTSASTYTFTPATAISLAQSQQYVVDVYADVLSTVTNSATAFASCNVYSVSATGLVTSSATSWTTGSLALQQVYINTSGTLTVSAAADTPTNDQLVLGSTGNVLAKFRFAANAVEDITVNKIFLSDRIRTDGGNVAATGTVRNISLWDGTTQVGSTVASLDSTLNTTTAYATFSNIGWVIPRNSAKTLTVKADYSTVDDGGVTSSTTRFVLATGYQNSTAGESIEARGASSGSTISGSTLVYNQAADTDVVANYFDVLKTKLSIAYAADAPSGLSAASSEQTVAKFVVSNSANAGNYTALVKGMDFNVSSNGASLSGASNLKVYKDSITTANQLAATPYCHATSLTSNACAQWSTGKEYQPTNIGAANFTDLYVAPGSSSTVIVTLGTANSGFTTNETLTVGINSGAVIWGDDAYASSVPSYSMITSLPLAGKTLYF